jgi:hypothetical protein
VLGAVADAYLADDDREPHVASHAGRRVSPAVPAALPTMSEGLDALPGGPCAGLHRARRLHTRPMQRCFIGAALASCLLAAGVLTTSMTRSDEPASAAANFASTASDGPPGRPPRRSPQPFAPTLRALAPAAPGRRSTAPSMQMSQRRAATQPRAGRVDASARPPSAGLDPDGTPPSETDSLALAVPVAAPPPPAADPSLGLPSARVGPGPADERTEPPAAGPVTPAPVPPPTAPTSSLTTLTPVTDAVRVSPPVTGTLPTTVPTTTPSATTPTSGAAPASPSPSPASASGPGHGNGHSNGGGNGHGNGGGKGPTEGND